MGLNELIDYVTMTREHQMNNLYRQPAEQLTALETLRYVERIERQLAQLTVENGRWRALAVAALRAYDDASGCHELVAVENLLPIMEQIREESKR
jgi:hypothetical protein